MGEQTGISWADHTFNPFIGCVKISPGCKNCYAESLNKRYGRDVWGVGKARHLASESTWKNLAKWNRKAEADGVRRRVFVGSLTDVMLDERPLDEPRSRLWREIADCPWLDFLLLTKRPENYLRFLPPLFGELRNLWLGVSIENDAHAYRADWLVELGAAVRYVSYEPALGPLDSLDLDGLDWIIVGGESGPGYRAYDPEWSVRLRKRCRDAGVAFFHKQGNGRRSGMNVALRGEIIQEVPLAQMATN